MIFTPFAFIQSPILSPIPTNGLVAWYDARDYTSGATWIDRSGNGNNLTLNNTFSKVTSPITAVFFNGGFGSKTSVNSWASTTEITHIEIIRRTTTTTAVASWGLRGTNDLSGFQFSGTNLIYTWVGGQTGYFLPQISGIYTNIRYSTTWTTFITRRFSSGYNNTGDSLVVNYADSNGVPLTKFGSGNFTLGRAGSTIYTIGGSSTIVVGAAENNLLYDMLGYYGVNIFYNRKLTDSEITQIYNLYKPLYSLS